MSTGALCPLWVRWIAAGAVALAACAVEDGELPVADQPLPIIGGVEDTGHPAVVMLQTQTGLCSGTLIADRVVLTAAHCVDTATGGTVLFGNGSGDPDAETVSIAQIMYHRYYDPSTIAIGLPYDIALVRLRDPAPAGIEPMPINLEPLDQSLVGSTLLAVGFGANDGENQTGFGTKRRVFLPINEILPRLIGMGDDQVNTCQGDSGGPGFYDIDGVETVIGITSTGPQGCVGNSHQTRVDVYRDDFILPILNAWTGPCQFDGVCVTEGCAAPDPDCDPCQPDAFCARGCPQLDLDCPVAGFAGDPCNDNDDCESRFCVAALDDPRIKYCSSRCDPDEPIAEQCDPPLGRCVAADGGEPACHYTGITPGAQGADCTDGSECRSGACDPDHGICVEQCGDGLPECPEGYSCESFGGGVKACTIPPDGCGCAAGARGRAANPWGLVGLALLGFFALRRRPRARHS